MTFLCLFCSWLRHRCLCHSYNVFWRKERREGKERGKEREKRGEKREEKREEKEKVCQEHLQPMEFNEIARQITTTNRVQTKEEKHQSTKATKATHQSVSTFLMPMKLIAPNGLVVLSLPFFSVTYHSNIPVPSNTKYNSFQYFCCNFFELGTWLLLLLLLYKNK